MSEDQEESQVKTTKRGAPARHATLKARAPLLDVGSQVVVGTVWGERPGFVVQQTVEPSEVNVVVIGMPSGKTETMLRVRFTSERPAGEGQWRMPTKQ